MTTKEPWKDYNAVQEGRGFWGASKLDEREWRRFFGDEDYWKNTEHPELRFGESPTVSTHVTHHIEEGFSAASEFGNTYKIAHVRGFHGKGFMAKLYNSVEWCGNGNLFYGTGVEAMAKAMEDGQNLVAQEDERRRKLNAEIERHREVETELDSLIEARETLREQLDSVMDSDLTDAEITEAENTLAASDRRLAELHAYIKTGEWSE